MAKPYKPVSLKFLADHLGLSQGTVSMALSADWELTKVAAKTRERVVKAAAEHNYRPNHHARSLSSGRSFTIGVIVPAISEGYYSTLISSIETQLLTEDYFFFVTSHRFNEVLLKKLPQVLLSRGAEGLIFINTLHTEDFGVPAVMIGCNETQPHSTIVSLDEALGTRLALDHLYALGHREVAFIRGEQESTATIERWAGTRKAARRLGICMPQELVVQLYLSDKHQGARYGRVGYNAAQQLLASKRHFTALVAYNDSTAIGAIRAFQDAGLRVPEDVSVVGYDDIPSAEYERPALTTVRQPLERIGTLATKTLLAAIGGTSQPPRILVEPELIVRGSTAPISSRLRRPAAKGIKGVELKGA